MKKANPLIAFLPMLLLRIYPSAVVVWDVRSPAAPAPLTPYFTTAKECGISHKTFLRRVRKDAENKQ